MSFKLGSLAKKLCLKDQQGDGAGTSRGESSGSGGRRDAGGSGAPGGSGVGYEEATVWSRGLERHFLGGLSYALAEGNAVMEDQSQVEISPSATFVGVYDGHGGPDCSRFVNQHLFRHFIDSARDNGGTITMDTVKSAIAAIEASFFAHMEGIHPHRPLIAAAGSCCLVGAISEGMLYVANLGDSRAVLGYLDDGRITAEQLTEEHNASREEIQREMRDRHPEDKHIVHVKNGTWRVKGIIQVTRAIGDAYLKYQNYRFDQHTRRYHFPGPLFRAIITAEPQILSRPIVTEDRFVIFASDGLWEHVSNQEAVEMVFNSPQEGIAKKLVQKAISEGVRKAISKSGDSILYNTKVTRRTFHDDITVIVLFVDSQVLQPDLSIPDVSFKGSAPINSSDFAMLRWDNGG